MKVLYNGEIVTLTDDLDLTYVTFADELKRELAVTDYIGIKIAEGKATREEYTEKIAERERLREMIRQLEE